MPELPEVETIRAGLSTLLRNARISGFSLKDRRLMPEKEEKRWAEALPGRRLSQFTRKGKYLGITLDNDSRLVFHLRMTGQLLVMDASAAPAKPRMTLTFDQNKALHFVDQRRFGEAWLQSPEQDWPARMGLGPDALEMTEDDFVKEVRRRQAPIQNILLDQRVIAGIGNIYAQEALFQAGITPKRRGRRVKPEEARRLFQAVQMTLKKAIASRGTSSRNYLDASGEAGSAQLWHAVYRKANKPCVSCKKLLKASKIGGRGVTYCRGCQK